MARYLLPKCIKHLAKCSDLDSSRYALGGVYFECDTSGVTLVSTDGRKLVMVRENHTTDCHMPFNTGTVIPAASLTKIPKTSNAFVSFDNPQTGLGCVTYQDITLEVYGRDDTCQTQSLERLDGRFPKYRDVVQPRESTAFVQVNPKLLKQICDVYIDAGVTEGVTMSIPTGDDEGTCVSFVAKDTEHRLIQGFLMPMTGDHQAVQPVAKLSAGKPAKETASAS